MITVRISRLAGDICEFIIPRLKTWKRIRFLMRINHYFMPKYGYWDKDGYHEF